MQLISILETIIIISILYTLYKAKHQKEPPEEYQKHEQHKREKLKYKLSDTIEKALTKYDQSGIRLPLDIIEELEYLNLTTDAEITAYIESQRIHWKYECMKKLFKGGLK